MSLANPEESRETRAIFVKKSEKTSWREINRSREMDKKSYNYLPKKMVI
ncbi:hypothetical protein IJG93_02465 [Candidatus Saccharibacteria bacterium]|nr:hypothetical protein [Candidatus Saccharibacteria bacterium]